MRRATARGRVFPQYFSTDRRYGRLSLKACALFPLMWANADDQGRLPGDPEEIKYAACPNIDHITKADISELLEELDKNQLIKVYNTSKTKAIQLLDWWEVQRLQWAWPSQYPPPDGWVDHLRYKKDAKTVIKQNWPVSGEDSAESVLESQVSAQEFSGESSGEPKPKGFPDLPKEKEGGKRRGRGKSPERSGERSPPSPADFSTDRNKISSELLENFRYWFGRVEAQNPQKVIPREPTGKELAQLRDLAEELVAGGGCPLGLIREAFRDASGQAEKSKHSVSYARSILLAWLGRPKNRSP